MKMFPVLRAALALALMISPAMAMTAAQIPTKFPIPWGNGAGGGFIRSIPVDSQIGIQNGAASLTDGFPPLTFVPVGSGGVPPFGQDFNGILNQISAWSRWTAASGIAPWDSSFSTAIGGYPKGAVVSGTSVGTVYLNGVDNNTTNPNSGGANWQPLTAAFTGDSGSGGAAGWVPAPPAGSNAAGYFLSASGSFAPPVAAGHVDQYLSATCPTGSVEGNGGTIGDASSGATLLASAATSALFANDWVLDPSVAPIQTSSGASSTRGVSAAADYAAHKRLVVPDVRADFLRSLDDGRGVDTGRLVGSAQTGATSASGVTASSSSSSTATFTGSPMTFGITLNGYFGANGSNASLGWAAGNTLQYSGSQIPTNTQTPTGTISASTTTTTTLSGGTETRPINVAVITCLHL